MLRPARCTNRTTDFRERKTDPQQALLQEGQCVRQTRSTPVRQEPIQQPAEQVKSLPQAGKLKYFVQAWKDLTQDPWVLETIQGYRIPFREQPPIKQIPSFVFSEKEKTALAAEIQKLLEKEAISPTEATDGFVSNVFLVPKKEDKWRLILNLKALNTYTVCEHFKMEDIRSVKDLLVRGDYMCKLDLKDAYLSVPITAAHRRYLQFQWQGVTYQYNALPFGLATAPRVFTKLLKPVLAHLRAMGLRIVAYLDDILLIGRNRTEAESAYHQAKQLLEDLGFVINQEKSQSEATQCIEFLGFMVNAVLMTFTLPTAKVREIKSKCKQALRQEKLSIRRLAHIIGVLVSTGLAILPAPLHYRGLQAQKIGELHLHHSYESVVTLQKQSILDLKWWISNLEATNGRPIHLGLPEMTIESDASNTGWGACWNNQKTGVIGRTRNLSFISMQRSC